MCALCSLMHACFCVWRIKKGNPPPENNCRLCCHSIWCPTQQRVKHPACEPWKNDISNWATRAEKVSSHIQPRGGWCLLTFQDGQTHQSVWRRTSKVPHTHRYSPPPSLPPFFSLTPRFSLNIVTFPDSESTVNSDSERASKWGKCVRCMCDVVLSSRQSQSEGARQPMWIDNKKKNNTCPLGGDGGWLRL